MFDFGFWWRMIRPHTLSASFAPVLVGTSFAIYHTGILKPLLFFAMLGATIAIQIATNLFNEYFDYVNGVDTPESIGNSGTIVRDGASPQFVMACALVCYAVALLLGVFLCMVTSWWLAVVGAICMLFGFLYGGGPYPISRTPLGEVFAGSFMGIGITLIAYYIQTGQVTWAALIVSFPLFVLIAQILTANSLRDRVNDIPAGRKTLAILLGHTNTVYYMIFCFTLAYIWPLVLWTQTDINAFILMPLFSVHWAVRSIIAFAPVDQSPAQMMPAMVATSKANKHYGELYALGFFLAYAVPMV